MRRPSLILLLLLLATRPAAAQFYTPVNGPATQRWSHIVTSSYDVIYPSGLDSLARVYATALEQAKEPVSRTIGFVPNQFGRRPFPVVLHTSDVYSNGLVAWTPHRMELITTPEADSPLPLPWEEQLVVHESRHVAQMQYLAAPQYRAFRILTGELAGGALSALYCGPAFFEGDAVVAETELSRSGRGRNADFLEYYRVSFATGDLRNYWRWRYGSQRLFTPNYYTVGYVTMAGIRTLYDEPYLTRRYYDRLLGGWPLPLFNWNRTVREVTGKSFKECFAEISDTLRTQWDRDAAARAPFIPMEQVTPTPGWYAEHTDNSYLGGYVFDIHSGLSESASLMRTGADGRESRVSAFSSGAGGLKPDPVSGRLYWSEMVPDIRWTDRSYSEIHYCHDDGRHHRLTRHTRYYNPAPSPDGSKLAVTEYYESGGGAAVVLDPADGSAVREYPAPEGMQVVEVEWAEDDLYASAITADGMGLYRVGDWKCVLAPDSAAIKELWHHDGRLYFTSDRTGVNELYSVCLRTGERWQLTSTPFGASEFQFNDAADTLIYSAPTPGGRLLYVTPADSLLRRSVPQHVFRTAEILGTQAGGVFDTSAPVEMSAPEKFSRPAHLFRFHSWLPFFLDYDNVSSLSLETIFNTVSLGATGFFQNLLGTVNGSLAYKAAPHDDRWFHSGHAKLTYTGLYPVIEASARYGTALSSDYYNYLYIKNGEEAGMGLVPVDREDLYWNVNLKAYVPLNFSSGGWSRGVVPQLSYGFCSDRFSSDWMKISVTEKKEPEEVHPGPAPEEEPEKKVERTGSGTFSMMSRFSASIRAYNILPVAPSAIYPRLGIGVETGWSFRPGAVTFDASRGSEVNMFSGNVYGFLYGYLPGFAPCHGIRLSAIAQRSLGEYAFGEAYASTAPRGIAASALMADAGYRNQIKLTLDYAMPFAPVDWSFLCPVAYIRNFELQPHFDLSFYGDKVPTISTTSATAPSSGSLWSAGTDLTVVLGNILWVPYVTRVGVSWSYNGGSLFSTVDAARSGGADRNVFGFIFEVDL